MKYPFKMIPIFKDMSIFGGVVADVFPPPFNPSGKKGLEALSLSRKSIFDKMIIWHSKNACSMQKGWVIFRGSIFSGDYSKMKITGKVLPWIITIKQGRTSSQFNEIWKNCWTGDLKDYCCESPWWCSSPQMWCENHSKWSSKDDWIVKVGINPLLEVSHMENDPNSYCM